MYLRGFDNLTPQQFKKMLTIGRWRDLESGHQILSEGDPSVIEIAFLYGAAEARKKNLCLGSYGPGDFAGIGCIVKSGYEFYDLTVTQPTRVMCWSHRELMQMLEKDPQLSDLLRKVAGASLAPALIRLVEPDNP